MSCENRTSAQRQLKPPSRTFLRTLQDRARGRARDNRTRIVLLDPFHDPERPDVRDEVADAGELGHELDLLLAREIEANSVELSHGREVPASTRTKREPQQTAT